MLNNDARQLINTTQPAPLQWDMLQLAQESVDYFFGRPYPRWAFGPAQWDRSRGPLPTPLPYVKTLVETGSQFVFRNGVPSFSVPDDEQATVFLDGIIKGNRLKQRYHDLAVAAAHNGAVGLKFSVDMDAACPVRITFLSVPDQVRFWFDPHDANHILMARIQYPYRDLLTGDWYLFREEWTEDLWVQYVPKFAAKRDVADIYATSLWQNSMGDGDDPWVIESQESNPFGLIPVTLVRNKTIKGNALGLGDCWSAFRLIDRIALTLHGEDISNQAHSRPQPVAINARIQNEGPMLPGEPLEVVNNGDKPADYKLVEPSGAAREWAHADISKWEELLYKEVGLSLVNSETVSNKGNLTALAFSLLYERTIASSDMKRENLGNSGLSVFFHNILIALSRLGGVNDVRGVGEDSEVACDWPAYFQETPQDLADTTTRTISQVQAGLLPHERGAERVAKAEKMPAGEIKELLVEVKVEKAKRDAQQEAQMAVDAPNNAGAGDVNGS